MRETHQLSLQVQHSPVHLLLTLPLDLLQSLRGIRLPVQPVERVRLLEGVVVAFRVRVCVTGEPARGLGHRERSGILVRLEEQEQLRLQRVAVARVEAQDYRPSPESKSDESEGEVRVSHSCPPSERRQKTHSYRMS